MDSIFQSFREQFQSTESQTTSLTDYLELCRTDRSAYAGIAERMMDAIGEPIRVDTSKDSRLSRLYGNRIIQTYAPFADFYGVESVVEQIVNYFRHNAQGLEESRQLLYLLGPVGGGKSQLVERLKELAEKKPIYTLGYYDDRGELQVSPYLCRVLPLFNRGDLAEKISKEYGIDIRYFSGVIGPWEAKRIKEFGGDISRFVVVRLQPSRLNQIAIHNTEPGDENTQDVSTLIGKVDIRKLEDFSQNDPDAYLYSGGLNLSNQGLLDFREMFKAKIKMLNPLLFAVQEHVYQGTEGITAMPYDGIVVSHSNEAEWTKFKNNKDNEAFLDRICIVKVPYCLRVDEEIKIYQKFVQSSDLKNAPIAPGTLEMLAQYVILTRLLDQDNSSIWSKMRVYNGENLKEIDPRAKTYHEYRDEPENRNEGFSGMSTRWASKRISQCFNADPSEIAADPVHMMEIIWNEIEKSDLPKDTEDRYKGFIKEFIRPKFLEFLDKEIRTAYLESYHEFGQNQFDRYIMWAEHWIEDKDFFDSETRLQMDKEALNLELEKIEKVHGIANPKDFRNEVVRYCLRYRADNGGKNPNWRSYAKMRDVIEKKLFEKTDDLLPVITFAPKGKEEERKKHEEFVERMIKRGYTPKQVKVLVDWFMKSRRST